MRAITTPRGGWNEKRSGGLLGEGARWDGQAAESFRPDPAPGGRK
jgi:hypothetical protein